MKRMLVLSSCRTFGPESEGFDDVVIGPGGLLSEGFGPTNLPFARV